MQFIYHFLNYYYTIFFVIGKAITACSLSLELHLSAI